MDKKTIKEAIDALSEEILQNHSSDLLYGIREGESPLAAWPAQSCRIVFLDFDGVLNSEASNTELGTRYQFADRSVKALNRILEETSAYIVVTSSWREHWTLKENAAALEQGGVIPGRVIGQTPKLVSRRGREIDCWLANAPFSVASSVILDDRVDLEPHMSRAIFVDNRIGLDESHIPTAVEILRRQR
jgi:hypothetical protein